VKTAFTWDPQARADLRGIDRESAIRILRALTRYAQTGEGDTKALQGRHLGQIRLRVGPWRVRFLGNPPNIEVLRIEKRGDAYRD